MFNMPIKVLFSNKTNQQSRCLSNRFTFSAFLSYLCLFARAIDDANGSNNKDRTGAGSTISMDSAVGSDCIPLIPISRTTTKAKQSEAFPYFEYVIMSWIRKSRSVIIRGIKITYSSLNILNICKNLNNFTKFFTLYIELSAKSGHLGSDAQITGSNVFPANRREYFNSSRHDYIFR